MAKRIKWTTNKLNKVRRAIKNGMKQKEVAAEFKCSQGTISRIFKMIEEEQLEKKAQKKAKRQPEQAISEPEVVELKRRGRPKKNLTEVSNHEAQEIVEVSHAKSYDPNTTTVVTVKRGRPKKASAVVQDVTNNIRKLSGEAISVKTEVPALEEAKKIIDEAEKINKQLEIELLAANNLLKQIYHMSWFQRKDCGKLITEHFESLA